MANRRPRSRALLPLGALALAVPALVPAARAEERVALRLETLVPSRTLALAGFEDIGSWGRRWKENAFAKMAADPEMAAFVGPLKEDLGRLLEGGDGKEDPIPPIVRKAFRQVQGLSGQAAVALVDVQERKGPVLAANLDFGEHLRDFTTFLQRMKEETGGDVPIETREVGGRAWFSMGDPDHPAFVATTIGTSVVASTDRAWLDGVVASSGAAATDALAGVASFTRARGSAGEGAALFVFGNVPSLLGRFGGDMPPDARRMLDTFGLDTVKGAAYSFGFHGDVFRETILVDAPGADHGLVSLMRSSPTTKGALPLVPSSAFLYAEGAMPLSRLLPEVRKMVAQLDPSIAEKLDGALADAKGATGVDLEKDVLGALADEVAYWLGLPETGGLYPELVFAIKVKDPATFEATAAKAVDGLLATVGRKEKVAASQRTIDYHGKRLHVIDLAGVRRRDMVPFTPTWAMVGDRWVLTLVPHAMKELVLRAEAGAPGLAAQEDFSKILRTSPEGATSIGYVDTQALLTLLYDTAAPLLQTIAKPNLVPVPVRLDFASLPATRSVRPYFRSLGMATRFDGDAMVVTMDSPVGYIAPLLLVAGGAAAMTAKRHAAAVEREAVEFGGREDASKVMVADLQVRSLVEAVRAYQAAKGSLPASLGVLTQETGADGQPFLDRMPTDPWGNSYEYVVEDAKAGTFVVWSAGPDRIPDTLDDVKHPTPDER